MSAATLVVAGRKVAVVAWALATLVVAGRKETVAERKVAVVA